MRNSTNSNPPSVCTPTVVAPSPQTAARNPKAPSFAYVVASSDNAPPSRGKRRVPVYSENKTDTTDDAAVPCPEEGGLLRSGKRRRIDNKSDNIALRPPSSEPFSPANSQPKSRTVAKMEQTVSFKPKQDQSAESTKTDICSKLDPIVFSVKNVRLKHHGEVTVRCESKDHAEKLTTTASELFGDKYDVEIQKPLKPRVKILGLSEAMGEEELITKLTKQNKGLESYNLKLVRMTKSDAHRNNQKSAIIETDARGFDDLIDRQRVYIGWERCRVVEATDVMRCFNCSEYGHKAASCQKPACCPKCAGDHQVNECSSEFAKCINCHLLNTNRTSSYDTLLDVSHSSWSSDCPIFVKRLKSARQRIDFSA